MCKPGLLADTQVCKNRYMQSAPHHVALSLSARTRLTARAGGNLF